LLACNETKKKKVFNQKKKFKHSKAPDWLATDTEFKFFNSQITRDHIPMYKYINI